MIVAQQQAWAAFRNRPFVRTIIVSGMDLTGASFAMGIKQYPDAAGSALVSIGTTSSPGAEGIRFAGVTLDADGIPESSLELFVTEAHINALPTYATDDADFGEPIRLFYDFVVTPPADAETPWTDNVEQTWSYGPFLVNGSATT